MNCGLIFGPQNRGCLNLVVAIAIILKMCDNNNRLLAYNFRVPMAHFPLLPHLPLRQITSNIYEVKGTMKLFSIFRYSRNMHIIKCQEGVILVNPVRVHEKTIESIQKIGSIKHIYKIGQFHNVDIPYYMDTFKPRLWKLKNDPSIPNYPADELIESDQELPPCHSKLRIIKGLKVAEAVIVHPDQGGTLISCDAFVNMGPDAMANWLTRNLTKLLPKPTLVGPNWIKFAKPTRDSLLECLEDEFENLITSHGPEIMGGAKPSLVSYITNMKIK